jgi:hypothetical protein
MIPAGLVQQLSCFVIIAEFFAVSRQQHAAKGPPGLGLRPLIGRPPQFTLGWLDMCGAAARISASIRTKQKPLSGSTTD